MGGMSSKRRDSCPEVTLHGGGNRSPNPDDIMQQVTAIVIGAGSRGAGYSRYALDFPSRLKIVGVAEPGDLYRNRMKNNYAIEEQNVFHDWKDIVARDKFADFVIIATPDRLHKDPAIACARKGYHILLEKPMAVTYKDCVEIVETCKENNCMLAVCHVLRYTPQAMKIREIIKDGKIGDVVNIQLLEPVGYWHFAHSYVRGKWRNEQESSFSLLAKSCHDLDLIQFWMSPNKCRNISSFGSLKHFKKSQKPPGAGDRCLDCGIEKKCPYSAKKIYMDRLKFGHTGFPVSIVADPPDIESLTEALKTGPYGRCVYDCDNDVMDNQVVNMQYEDGASVSFSMVGFTDMVCERQIRVFGTKGELTCNMQLQTVKHVDFADGQGYTYTLTKSDDARSSRLKGHGGADFYAVDAFINAISTNDPEKILTGAEDSLHSHLLCFLAEKARKENKVINVQEENLDQL